MQTQIKKNRHFTWLSCNLSNHDNESCWSWRSLKLFSVSVFLATHDAKHISAKMHKMWAILTWKIFYVGFLLREFFLVRHRNIHCSCTLTAQHTDMSVFKVLPGPKKGGGLCPCQCTEACTMKFTAVIKSETKGLNKDISTIRCHHLHKHTNLVV